MMREHVKPTVRMHYVIPDGGDVPNVVPDHAKLWLWARDFERKGVDDVLARLRKMAEGAALMAGVRRQVTVQAGDYEILVNETGARLLDANLRWVGPSRYTPEEEAFARELQKAAGVEPVGMDAAIGPLEGQAQEGGSTDVGDVSWNVPTLHVSVATAPRGVPWHAWPVVAAGGMSIGHKGMVLAAKTLAATMVDLFDDPAARAAVRAEFERKTQGFVYRPPSPTARRRCRRRSSAHLLSAGRTTSGCSRSRLRSMTASGGSTPCGRSTKRKRNRPCWSAL